MSRYRIPAVLLAALFVSFATLALWTSRTQAEEATVEQLFSQALRSDGVEYVNARKAIVERKAESLPFLKSKRSDKDWRTRVLAEAMIGRMEEPEQYASYEYQTIGSTRWKMQHIQSFYSLMDAQLHGVGPYAFDSQLKPFLSNRYGRKQAFGVSGAPFLVELALKGSVLKKPTVNYQLPPDGPDTRYTIPEVAGILNVSEKLAGLWMRPYSHPRPRLPEVVEHIDLETFINMELRPDTRQLAVDPEFRESARCAAMLVLGDCFNKEPVTIPALVELLQSKESTMIRGYAALALGVTGKEEAIDPLTQAQNDTDKQVKEAAQQSLVTLQRIMEVESKRNQE